MQGWKLARAADEARKYRALSIMASEARDYQNEREFFALEQRCRCFWLGWLYDRLSNYGRSFLRPFVFWWLTWAAFAALFAISTTGKLWHIFDPVFLSFRHGLIISGLPRNGHLKEVLERMYEGGHIPDLVSLAMLAQPLISAFWLFLLLLALRNQFKIK